jgi:hypothetical protein
VPHSSNYVHYSNLCVFSDALTLAPGSNTTQLDFALFRARELHEQNRAISEALGDCGDGR